MTAYKIKREDREIKMDLGYRYRLPRLECSVCTPNAPGWAGRFEYPALKFEFLNEKEFNVDRVVTLTEMSKIRRRFEAAAGRKLNLVPGAEIGEMSGRAFTKDLLDFEWGRIGAPQISRRAFEKLASEGLQLLTAEFRVFIPGKKDNSHLAIQLEPFCMLTDESLRRHRVARCPRCGQFIWPPPPWPRIPEGFAFKRSAWPEGHDLVKVEESMDVIASEKFIGAYKKHKMRGLTFIPCGRFV